MKKNDIHLDMMLSDDFRLGEFIESETAQLYHIDNSPTWEVVLHLHHLCREVLQPLRRHYGRPIRIASGYRCEALNELVHGVGNSLHLCGCAADLHLPDIDTGRAWYHWIVDNLDFDQVLLEYSRCGAIRLHVSYKADSMQNRHQAFFNYRRSRP